MTNDAVSEPLGKVGIVWGGDPHAEGSQARVLDRAGGLIEALTKRGVAAEVIIYSDDVLEETRNRLLNLDAVLVWVDPIMGDGHDRTRLDALLRDVASLGVRVSTHPDVILKMGTKEVLVRTRDLPWGTDAHLYRTSRQMRKELPLRLGAGAARVLKQNRGNGGNGVWKVELARAEGGAPEDAGKTAAVGSDTMVRVLHALRGSAEEEMRLDEFIGRCGVYFSNSGCMVDQPYQPRLVDGMIRCYLVQGKVAGFGHQFVRALMRPPPPEAGPEAAVVPPRLYYGPEKPEFQALRAVLESDWVPAMQRVLDIDKDSLPILWDADFLYGPKTESGADTYVLCEINVSSVSPFPEEAVEEVAEAAVTSMLAKNQTPRQ